MSATESFEDLLMLETSRRNTDLVSEIIFAKPALFEDLMKIYLRNEEPVSRRAAWVVDNVSEKKPELLDPWLDQIAEKLPAFSHDGMKRHSLRMLMRSPLPGSRIAGLINICFEFLASPTEAIAAKVYSMEILYRISVLEPGIKQELADTIEWKMEEESAGFKNKGKKLLKKIHKELRDLQNYPY